MTSIRCCRFEPKALQIRDSLEAQNSLYPRLYLSSPMVAAAFAKLSVFDYTKSSTEIPRFKKEGYDFMKVMSGLNPITHKSMMEICNSIDFPVVGHLPRSVGLDYAIRSRQRDIEHFQGYANINDKQVLDSFIQETAKADIYNCPTIFWYDANYPFLDSIYLRSVDGLQYIPASLRDSWAANHRQSRAAMQGREGAARTNSRKYVLERFAQSNAKLLLSHGDGGYCVPGFGMLEEAKIFQEAGLSNYRILQSACSHPAEFFGEGHSWGKVAEGFLADLILLRQNPLEDIQHLRGIKGVMLEGRWLDEAEIESKLRAILEENERE
ncbi:MAG: amidohydrolase family protein [Saprospiraceae bacterium]|nr:amidohydrolase family protein [Saprospiraceae bacterium]